MVVRRFAFVLAACAALATGCSPALPAAGNYATVLGRVTDTAGAGIANVTVTVNSVTSSTTDVGGNFKIPNVPTGAWDYSVVVPKTFVTPSAVDNPQPLLPGEQRTLTISLQRSVH